MKLSPEILEELKKTDSIKRKDEIINAIEDRTQKIIEAIVKIFKIKKVYWWAWEYYENSDDDAPSFKRSVNITKTSLVFGIFDAGYDFPYLDEKGEWSLNEGCPINWLWDDFEKELKDGVEKYKQKEEEDKKFAKARREELKQLKQKYSQSAKQKLTPEELWATGLSTKIPKELKKFQCDEE